MGVENAEPLPLDAQPVEVVLPPLARLRLRRRRGRLRRCRTTAGSNGYSCRGFRKEVQSRVSSRTKMIAVWCTGGHWAEGTQTLG